MLPFSYPMLCSFQTFSPPLPLWRQEQEEERNDETPM